MNLTYRTLECLGCYCVWYCRYMSYWQWSSGDFSEISSYSRWLLLTVTPKWDKQHQYTANHL